MKCPFCNSDLVREGSNNYWCKKCNLERYSPALYGSKQLWQELIRARKALEIAVDALNISRDCAVITSVARGLEPKEDEINIVITKALEQITALTKGGDNE